MEETARWLATTSFRLWLLVRVQRELATSRSRVSENRIVFSNGQEFI
jgi:hypothetical protein